MLLKVKNKKSHLRQYFCLGSFLKQSYRYVLWFKIDLGCAEPRRKFSEAERKKSYHNSGEAGTELGRRQLKVCLALQNLAGVGARARKNLLFDKNLLLLYNKNTKIFRRPSGGLSVLFHKNSE